MASTSYDININTNQAIRSIKELNTALAGLATGAVLKGFLDIIDKTTNLQNRFQMITQEGQTSADVFKILAKTSNDLGAPLENVGTLFFRIANSTKDLSLSQEKQVRLTELLTKSFQSHGLSVSEANSAMTQFTQGLAKGTFNGDELNSILENAPPIAQAIADKLGVTTGALKTLGSQGKLNSKLVVDAMLEAGKSIDQAFANRVPTISNAWSVFGNTLDVVTDKFNKDNNVVQGVSLAIIKLATAVINISNFFTKWGGIIYDVLTLLAAFLIPVRLISAGVALLGGAMTRLSTVWGSISTVVAATTGLFEKFKVVFVGVFDAIFPTLAIYIDTFGKMIATTLAFIASFLGLESVFQGIKNFFKDGEKDVDPYKQAVNDLNKALGIDQVEASKKAKEAKKASTAQDLENVKLSKKSIDELTRAYADMNSQIIEQSAGIGLGSEQQDKLRLQTDAANKYTDAIRKINDEFAKTDQTGSQAEKDAINKLTIAYKNEIETLNQRYDAKIKEQRLDELRVFNLKEQYNTQDKLNQLQNEINKTTMSEVERKYYDIKQAAEESVKAELRAAAERRGIKVEDMPITDVQAYYDAANKGIAEQIAKTDELNKVQSKENIRLFALKEQYKVQDDLKKLQDEINTSTMSELERKYYDIKQAAEETARSEIRAAAARQNIKVEDMPIDQIRAYYDAAYQGMADLTSKTKEQYDVSREFSTGWKKAFADYTDDATNAAKTAQELFSTTTKGIEDMLVGFTKTGKFAWKEMLASMMEDLLRSQIKQTIASIFGLAGAGATGGSKGGSGGLLGLLGFANGGIIPTNGPVIVGERGPELLSGAAGMTVTPNNQLGGVTNITYSINAVDAMSFKQMIAADPTFLYAVTEQGRRKLPGGR